MVLSPTGEMSAQAFLRVLFWAPFSFYVNDIPQTLSCSSEMFADDTPLYNSDSVDFVSAPVQQVLNQLDEWCSLSLSRPRSSPLSSKIVWR